MGPPEGNEERLWERVFDSCCHHPINTGELDPTPVKGFHLKKVRRWLHRSVTSRSPPGYVQSWVKQVFIAAGQLADKRWFLCIGDRGFSCYPGTLSQDTILRFDAVVRGKARVSLIPWQLAGFAKNDWSILLQMHTNEYPTPRPIHIHRAIVRTAELDQAIAALAEVES